MTKARFFRNVRTGAIRETDGSFLGFPYEETNDREGEPRTVKAAARARKSAGRPKKTESPDA